MSTPATRAHHEEQSKQMLLQELLPEDHDDAADFQRPASRRDIASQFFWMGWVSFPGAYIGLFQSVSFAGCLVNAMHACRPVDHAEQ